MNVLYSTPGHPRYECVNHLSRGERRTCPGIVATPLDTLVDTQLLRVLTPAEIELSLKAAENIEEERAQLDVHWKAEIERAAYEVQLAQRNYRTVDAENRLVARTLENQWEQALRHEQDVRERYDRFRKETPRRLTSEELGLIRSLAADIPSLWRATDTSATDRKEILRTLIDRVSVTIQENSEHVKVQIYWVGGSVSEHPLRRPVGSYERLADFSRLRQRVQSLLEAGQSMAQIAEAFNQEGFSSPSGRLEKFTSRHIGELVYRLGLSKKRCPAESLSANEFWVRDLATEVGVSVTRLRHWMKSGYVHTRKSKSWGQLIIWVDVEELARLRRLRDHPRQNRLARYPVGLTLPKERQNQVSKKRAKEK